MNIDIDIRCSDGVIVLGSRGSGKSVLIQELMKAFSEHFYVILDVIGDMKHTAWSTHYRIDPRDDKYVSAVITDALKTGNCMLILDEADQYNYPIGKQSALSKAVNLGRHYNVGYIASARRTANISKDFLSNSDWAFIFRHTLPADLRVLTQWFSLKAEEIRDLEQYQFYIIKKSVPVGKGKVSLVL